MENFGLINLLKSVLFAEPPQKEGGEQPPSPAAPSGEQKAAGAGTERRADREAQEVPQTPDPDEQNNAFLKLMARHEKIAQGAKQNARSPRPAENPRPKNK